MYIKFTKAYMQMNTGSHDEMRFEKCIRYEHNPVLVILHKSVCLDSFYIATIGDRKEVFYYIIDKPFDSLVEAETELKNIISMCGEEYIIMEDKK